MCKLLLKIVKTSKILISLLLPILFFIINKVYKERFKLLLNVSYKVSYYIYNLITFIYKLLYI